MRSGRSARLDAISGDHSRLDSNLHTTHHRARPITTFHSDHSHVTICIHAGRRFAPCLVVVPRGTALGSSSPRARRVRSHVKVGIERAVDNLRSGLVTAMPAASKRLAACACAARPGGAPSSLLSPNLAKHVVPIKEESLHLPLPCRQQARPTHLGRYRQRRRRGVGSRASPSLGRRPSSPCGSATF